MTDIQIGTVRTACWMPDRDDLAAWQERIVGKRRSWRLTKIDAENNRWYKLVTDSETEVSLPEIAERELVIVATIQTQAG